MSDAFTEFAPLRYDQQQIAHQGWGVANSGATDDKLIVGFYRKSVLNTAKSRELGKRICEDHDYVMISHPGETLTKVDRPVQDSDKHRWPRQWAQYAQGKQQVPDGIPITLLFPAHPSISDTLLGYNIHTVEQLANLSANGIQTVGMGCQDWVNRAKKYMDQANKGVDFHKFEKTIEEKDKEIAKLSRQVGELSRQVEKIISIQQPQQFAPPPTYDVQTALINANAEEQIFAPPAQVFSQGIVSPDLSQETQQRKPRADKGKPRGPRKGT